MPETQSPGEPAPPAPPGPPGPPLAEDVDALLLSRYGREVVALLERLHAGGDDLQAALDQALQATVRATGAERGFVLLFEEGGRIQLRSAFHISERQLSPERLRLSFGVVMRLVQGGQALRIANVASDPAFDGNQSVHAMGLTSLLAIPVPGASGPMGILYLDSRTPSKTFSAEDEALLVRFARFLGGALRLSVASRQRALQVASLQQALASALKDLQARYRFDALIGESPAMCAVRTTLDHIVRFSYPVLILGETGTGKEMVAKAIHGQSPRREQPLVAVNCAALSPQLLESELFGHVRGAFTGADHDRPGLFTAANRGTLLLDEIGEMPEELQRKLLRVLQEGEVIPVGSTTPVKCDVRVLAATHRDLDNQVKQGTFREDLYYRLKVFKVVLPPLRERATDIPVLARHLLGEVVRESGSTPREIAPDALECLVRYPWPGNVRELENALRYAVAFSTDRIRPEHLPAEVRERPKAEVSLSALDGLNLGKGGRPVDELWKALIVKTLEATAGNQSAAAKELGISRATLARKLKLFGIKPPA